MSENHCFTVVSKFFSPNQRVLVLCIPLVLIVTIFLLLPLNTLPSMIASAGSISPDFNAEDAPERIPRSAQTPEVYPKYGSNPEWSPLLAPNTESENDSEIDLGSEFRIDRGESLRSMPLVDPDFTPPRSLIFTRVQYRSVSQMADAQCNSIS